MDPVKQHYDQHLAHFYAWMTGNLAERQAEFRDYLHRTGIQPTASATAIDLGCGHGIHSIALAQAGFAVVAIDFCQQLLAELSDNATGLTVRIVNDDIRNILNYCHLKPELITCCGDTLTHLETKQEVLQLIGNCTTALQHGGRLVLSFRDYSEAPAGNKLIIPVKSDDQRKLTCILEYGEHHVTVTDQLEERSAEGWNRKTSTYRKVRISVPEIVSFMEECGLEIGKVETLKGMVHVLAGKPGL